MDFKQYLSPKREAVPTPADIADELGNCYFGTFDKEFSKMDFLHINKPTALPNFLNKYKLTLWEAAEIHFGDLVVLTAVCNMGLIGTALTVLYDKRTKKCTSWQEILPSKKACISQNLINGAESYSAGNNVRVRFVNDFQDGKAIISGYASNKKSGTVDYRVKLTRVSKPSIVNIPFDSNRPLYSQKDLFKAEGYIEFNGERFYTDDASTSIIDDHRGYYPRHAHYDWVTTLGKKEIDGKQQYFGFNLTRNQSINQKDYNENLIWFEGETTLLTPVVFKHETEKLWHIKDSEGMVDVTFEIADEFLLKLSGGIIKIDYHITFGELKGYICSPDGTKYSLDKMLGIGEDKTIVF